MSRSLRAVLASSLAAALTACALIGGPAVTAAAAETPGSTFTPRSPLRVLDTRTSGGPVGAGGTVTINLTSRVPATATAVILNVTGVAPTASTFVTAYPGGTTRPTASSLNLTTGEIRANQVTVALGADRTIRLYNNSGRVDLIADLAGHYGTTTAAAKFTVLAPNRVLDTRSQSPLGSGGTRVLDLSNSVPASATAVTFNLTATGPTASTYVTAWPGGATRPTASNLNVVAGETRPNLVTVAVGVDRTVQLYNNSGNVHLLADLTGFYTPDYGAEFVPLPPTRVLDTRAGTGLTGPLGPDLSATLDVTANVPVNATGVAMNLTGVGATTSTYVTAWGQLLIRPFESSTLNLVPGKAVPNAATVAFGKQRGIDFYNHRGSTHLIADLSGVFVVPSTDCAPGCVRAWGANDARKLGTSQTVPFSATPTPVVGLSAVRQVVGGGWDGTSYALLENGTVRAWGDNSAGQLGNGWVGPAGVGSSVPVPVVGLTSVTALSTKGYTTFALRSNGTVWGWGSGPLGNGASLSSSVPVPVSNLTGVVEVAAGGQATYALRTDGTVWAWGWNTNGELGTGSPAYPEALTPVRIPTLSGVVSVASGGNTGYAVKSDGTLWAWGWNGAGQLGNGQICDPEGPCESRVPVQVTGLTGVSKVTADGSNAYALRTDGTVAAWGDGNNGNLGDGVPCDAESCVTSTPVAVAGLTSVTSVATFEWGAYALRSDGTVWAWGDNTYQSLGDESVDGFAPTPVRVPGLSGIRAIGGAALAGYAIVANP